MTTSFLFSCTWPFFSICHCHSFPLGAAALLVDSFSVGLLKNIGQPSLCLRHSASWYSESRYPLSPVFKELLSGIKKKYCLSLGSYHKSIIDWVLYRQQKFISHSSGGWEVWDQGTSIHYLWRFSCWLANGCLLAASSHAGERAFWCLFLFGTVTLEVRVSTWTLGGHNSVHSRINFKLYTVDLCSTNCMP